MCVTDSTVRMCSSEDKGVSAKRMRGVRHITGVMFYVRIHVRRDKDTDSSPQTVHDNHVRKQLNRFKTLPVRQSVVYSIVQRYRQWSIMICARWSIYSQCTSGTVARPAAPTSRQGALCVANLQPMLPRVTCSTKRKRFSSKGSFGFPSAATFVQIRIWHHLKLVSKAARFYGRDIFRDTLHDTLPYRWRSTPEISAVTARSSRSSFLLCA